MSVILERPITGELTHIALVLTHKCQAKCLHCYNGSGPKGTHGTMSQEDWLSAISQSRAMGAWHVQFIGGEPTLYPGLPKLVDYALWLGMRVEVFSNLSHIDDDMWRLFSRDGVTLATSYYSPSAPIQDAIMQLRGGHKRITASIKTALALGIPLRVEVVELYPGQGTEQALADLTAFGVEKAKITHVREVGRAARDAATCNPNELCGKCGLNKLAVLPDGSVALCIMAEKMPSSGNVQTAPLTEIYGNDAWLENMVQVPRAGGDCGPDIPPCGAACGPDFDPPCGASVA